MHPFRGKEDTADEPARASGRFRAGRRSLLLGVVACLAASAGLVVVAPWSSTAARPGATLLADQAARLRAVPVQTPSVAPDRVARARKTTIGLFTATPATLSAAGGKVRLLAIVQSATTCRFSSAQAFSRLPTARACRSGSASLDVEVPRNSTFSARTFRFRLTVTSSRGTVTAAPVAVVQSAPGRSRSAPAITSEPVAQSVQPGAGVTFTASASGKPAPTVRWELSRNGGGSWANIAGADSASYSFTASAGENGQEYRAVFTNVAGSATTRPATLTVSAAQDTLPPSTQAPIVTAQPSGESVVAGAEVTFSAAASGTPAPTIQWQVSLDGGNSWADVGGATSASYSLIAVIGDSGQQYRAVFANTAGTVVSDAATLTVSAPGVAPAITTQPGSQSAVTGATATFTAAASGVPTPSVQWQVSINGGATWTNVSGASSTSYAFTAATSESGYEYRAVFTNAAGTATTSAATLTVSASASAPTITAQPTAQTVLSGATATFTAAASGTPTPTVQWQVSANGGSSWANVSGATSTSYSFVTATSENGYEYRAVFTNSVATATTNAATLTVTTPNAAPAITLQPLSQSVVSGAAATFTAAASGTPTPTVQWQVSADGGGSWANVSGATSTSYSFSATTSENGYQYRAVFTNSVSTATTDAATLTVSPPESAPSITLQPAAQSVVSGTSVTFSAAASGSPTPTVQWQVSTNGGIGWGNVPGATSTSYAFTAATSESGYEYRAVFTNAAGTATTSAATLTVSASASAPMITAQPTAQTVLSGATATFTASASGAPTPTAQWQVSTDGGTTWGNVAGATSASYSFAATTTEDGYEYRAVFSNTAGTATSQAAGLTVTAGQTSDNWSGYVDLGSPPSLTFSSVSGDWVVPTAVCSQRTTYSSAWVGIDGDPGSDDSVEQDGTEADCLGGTPTYSAWYEMYGDSAVAGGDEVPLSAVSYPVDPGDAMSASASLVGSDWVLALADGTQNWSFSISIASPDPEQASAEWIVESPEICTQSSCSNAALTDFGSVTFSDAFTDFDGSSGSIGAFDYSPIDMANGSTVRASPGALSPSGSSFTDTWRSS